MKVIDTTKLLSMVTQARNKGYNRQIPTFIAINIDPNGKHVLVSPFLHGDDQIRCRILIKINGSDEPYECYMDIDLVEYNKIYEHEGTK